MVESQGNHFRTHSIVFYHMFYDDDNDYQALTFERTKHFFNLNDIASFVNQSVSNYYDVDDGDMLDIYV